MKERRRKDDEELEDGREDRGGVVIGVVRRGWSSCRRNSMKNVSWEFCASNSYFFDYSCGYQKKFVSLHPILFR